MFRGRKESTYIKGTATPAETAHATVGATSALLDGGDGARPDDGQDDLAREGSDQHGRGHPAVHVALEGCHIAVAGGRLAVDLEGDAGLAEEDVDDAV